MILNRREGKTAADATPEQLELIATCLQRGDFDLLALGRALLANPDWVTLVGQKDVRLSFSLSPGIYSII